MKVNNPSLLSVSGGEIYSTWVFGWPSLEYTTYTIGNITINGVGIDELRDLVSVTQSEPQIEMPYFTLVAKFDDFFVVDGEVVFEVDAEVSGYDDE